MRPSPSQPTPQKPCARVFERTRTDGMAVRQGVADDQSSGSTRCTQTRIFMFDLDLPWCERHGSRRHGLLGSREDVACGHRTRYVLGTLDSEVPPFCIHGLNNSSAGPVCPFGILNCSTAFAHPARGTAKAFTSRFWTSPNCAATLFLNRQMRSR
jgi:hypothetical protein